MSNCDSRWLIFSSGAGTTQWGKASTKSIDLLGNSCILSIANIELTLIQFATGA